jgi:hypothetical protein
VDKQRKLITHLQKLRNQSSDPQSSNIHSIREYAFSIQADLTKALLSFAQRTTPIKLLDELLNQTKDHDTELDPGRWPRKFCYGALLLQSDDYLDGATLASDPTLYILGFTCKYCNLEVGDYRMSKWGKTVISTRLLAASHVISCPSFTDRRAAYKCLPCHAKHFDIDFPSAAALGQHLKKHPNSRREEEKDVVEELNINPKELGLEAEEENLQKDGALPKQQDSAESSLHERSASFATSVKTTATIDAVSISSTDEPGPKPAPNAPWDTGPVTFEDYYPDKIPELDSNDRYPTPPRPTWPPQATSRPGSTYPPQAPPQATEYPMSNGRPSIDIPSRNQTPSPYPPGYPPPSNAGYQAQSEGPPPPIQSSYPTGPPMGRISSDSARYQQGAIQRSNPLMNDLSQGYHPQQPQRRQPPEPEKKKRGLFKRREQ